MIVSCNLNYLGYPIKPGYAQYGLFDPGLDRFVHVNSDLQCALDVRILAVSRFHVEVIQLDTANNYHSNMIDNDVCESWTFVRTAFEDFWGVSHDTPYMAAELRPSPVMESDASTVHEEKTWFQVYWHWVSFVRKLPDLMIFNNRMQSIMSMWCEELASQHEQQSREVSAHAKPILEYLLFESDPLVCQNCIMSYVMNNQALSQAYQDWPRCL